MDTRNFITKEELIRDLGISRSTFYRRVRALNLPKSGHLLPLKEAQQFYKAFGISLKDDSNSPQTHPRPDL